MRTAAFIDISDTISEQSVVSLCVERRLSMANVTYIKYDVRHTVEYLQVVMTNCTPMLHKSSSIVRSS